MGGAVLSWARVEGDGCTEKTVTPAKAGIQWFDFTEFCFWST